MSKKKVIPLEFRLASPKPVKIGDKDVLLHPLSLKDMGILRNASRDRAVAAAREKIKFLEDAGIATPENKKEQSNILFGRIDSGAAHVSWITAEEGTAMSLWLMAKKSDPNITLEEVSDNITFDNLPYWQQTIDELSYPSFREDDEEEDEGEKIEEKKDDKPGSDPNEGAPETTGAEKK